MKLFWEEQLQIWSKVIVNLFYHLQLRIHSKHNNILDLEYVIYQININLPITNVECLILHSLYILKCSWSKLLNIKHLSTFQNFIMDSHILCRAGSTCFLCLYPLLLLWIHVGFASCPWLLVNVRRFCFFFIFQRFLRSKSPSFLLHLCFLCFLFFLSFFFSLVLLL